MTDLPRRSPIARGAFVLALICLATSCAGVATPTAGRGGYQDLEVPRRWGAYPLAGALARLDGSAGLDWEDHLTNCGLTDEWIEEMRAAWWSEREYDIRSFLAAQLDAPIAEIGNLGGRAETVRIRYGGIGGETAAENVLIREARAKRAEMLEACPLLDDPEIFWIEEAIYADEVTITLETAAGDTLGADVVRGLIAGSAHWSVSEAGVMRADERVYVAFRNASPARLLLEAELAAEDRGRLRGVGDFLVVPLALPFAVGGEQ